MQLGVSLPLATSAADVRQQVRIGQIADELGFHSVWIPEAYGSDAASILAAIAVTTSRIAVGAGVMQIPARTPAMTAMTAAGIDALSAGRFRLGLGVSGPQVSEGWHGVSFADPLGRTAEYLAIVRKVLARRRVTAEGPHFPLPIPDGAGRALMLALDPERREVPIYLAAVGVKNLDLTARIADGWLGIFFDAERGRDQVLRMRQVAAAAGRSPDQLDLAVQVPVALADSPTAAADALRPYAALYIGGMGSRQQNFYHRLATSMGYGREADLVQEHFLGRDRRRAEAAVPQEFLERTCLIGDEGQIAAGLTRLAGTGIDTVNINPVSVASDQQPELLAAIMQVARRNGIVDE